MKIDVNKLDGGTAGSVDLGEEIFGLKPRADILHRVVRWQRKQRATGHPQGQDPLGEPATRPRRSQAEGHRRRTPR